MNLSILIDRRQTPPPVVATVQRCLALGRSQNEVAREAGVSRSTVVRIGKTNVKGIVRRCGGCGGKILPGACVACNTRAHLAELARVLVSREKAGLP